MASVLLPQVLLPSPKSYCAPFFLGSNRYLALQAFAALSILCELNSDYMLVMKQGRWLAKKKRFTSWRLRKHVVCWGAPSILCGLNVKLSTSVIPFITAFMSARWEKTAGSPQAPSTCTYILFEYPVALLSFWRLLILSSCFLQTRVMASMSSYDPWTVLPAVRPTK